ncbi:hypothetical protein CPB86DRAFT_790047, partial [Serendipita vermifera]
ITPKPGINRTVAIILFTLLGLMVLLFLFCAVRSFMRLREQRKEREKGGGQERLGSFDYEKYP